ncbi:hypothetical protein EXD76_01090 [BEV proteobacterium]|nr:hypothetical protein [Candidatus Symbiopectobacterium sp. Chty_BC]
MNDGSSQRKNHVVRLNEKTVHLRGQAFSTKTGMEKQHYYLLFNKAPSEMNPTVFHEELRHHLMRIVYKMHNPDYDIL